MGRGRFRSPLGTSDFRKLRLLRAGYVDKTAFVSTLIDDPAAVILLPRPRRFGKTLNLSTLRYFLERTDEDRSPLFEGLQVWDDPEARRHFARYPVIWLTFKDVKFGSWEACFQGIRATLGELYEAHRYLLDQGVLSPESARRFRAVLNQDPDPGLYWPALKELARYLEAFHGEPVVILVDEYDTPLHAAYTRGYYEEAVDFFRALLSGGLKDNPHLFKGVLTGILRVARESLFSGLNNLVVYSILHRRYATAFGFTEAEVARVVDAESHPEAMEAVRTWYDGYRFGGETVYNPWSVLNFVARGDPFPQPYWVQTGSDDLLRELLLKKGHGLTEAMERLMAGESVRKRVDENIVLRDVHQRPDAVWSFLLFSGYLTPEAIHFVRRQTMVDLVIPNLEVQTVFQDMFLAWVSEGVGSPEEAERLASALLEGDGVRVEEMLSRLLLHHLSTFDGAGRQPEKLYQGFILGLLVVLEGTHEVRSNRETGFGRADVLVKPREPGRPGVVMELKVLRAGETPEHALEAALAQVEERRYAAELEAAGATPVHTFAVVFDGKRVWVETR